MSLNSPAKQERIERHLIRQRGAGVRTISASFGFAFGTSAPTSSNATPTPHERSPKRRKTTLQTVIIATNTAVEPPSEASKAEKHTSNVKPTKNRRRWVPQEDREDVTGANEAVDSFIAGIATKRSAKRAVKTDEVVSATQNVLPEPEPDPRDKIKRRPERRAAKTAASKVTDGFVTESLPIDMQRRDVEAVKKSSGRKAKQEQTMELLSRENDVAVEYEPVPKVDVEVRDRPTKATKKTKTAKKAALERKASLQRHEVPMMGPNDSKGTPLARRKLFIDEVEHELVSGVAESEKTQADEEMNAALHKASRAARKKRAHQKEAPARAENMDAVASIPSQLSTVELRRQPLMEVDSNSPVRSRTLGKRRRSDDKGRESTSGALRKTERLIATQNEHSKSKQRGKSRVQVEREFGAKASDEPSVNANIVQATLQVPSAPRQAHDTGSSGAAHRQLVDPHDQRSTTLTAKIKKQSKLSSVNTTERPTVLINAPAKAEEDIDWLFETHQPKRLPHVSAKRIAGQQEGPRTPRKMADIDLDDLLSNIASFAKTDGQNHTIDAVSTVQGGKAKVASRTRKRR